MKKIVSVISMLAVSLGLHAGEHDGAANLEYSVFGFYNRAPISNPAAAQATQQKARQLFNGWNAGVDKHSGLAKDMFGPAVSLPGNTNRQKADAVLNGKLSAFGVEAQQWKNVRDSKFDHAAYVDYVQEAYGREVVFSRMSFRFTTDGKLQRVKMRFYGNPEKGLVPTVSSEAALASGVMNQGLTDVSSPDVKMVGDWVWFPVPVNSGYELHPAWKFTITGMRPNEMPADMYGYIDATTGALLYRTSNINETFEVKVTGEVYKTNPNVSTTVEPLQAMRVTIGGTNYYTDDTGLASVASANAPANVTYTLRGRWSRVYDENNNTPSFTKNMTTSGDVYQFPTTNGVEVRHITAFYHVNIVHDYMKTHYPSFTVMDNEMRTNIDRSGNTCNAFYNGTSINFYKPQSTCRAFSEVGDIVYHEYGHGISRRFYQDQSASFTNGALGEANSDVWAMSINQDGIVGEGAFYSGGNIRNYTGTPKVYPNDIKGEVHADGEILAGAWWDVAVNIANADSMAILFALTQYDVPDGPSGTEGEIYHDILISALMNDDDDANLGNGTPHFKAIVEAFAKHGIFLLQDATIEHTEVAHQTPGAVVTLNAKLTLANPTFFNKLQLVYRDRYNGSGWDTTSMTNTTGNDYTGQIPGYPGGTIVDYYFIAADVINASAFGLPRGFKPDLVLASQVTLPYQFGFGINNRRMTVDFEGTLDGWQIGLASDDATSGQWIQDVPVGTSIFGSGQNLPIQPGQDHTTGTGKCLVTGNAGASSPFSFADIDNGKTTVLTPVFQMPFYQPIIEYYRWFSNDRGSTQGARNDYWTVEVRAENSQLWRRVDYTRESDQAWRRRIFRVSEFLPGINSVQVRFIATDELQSSLPANGQDIVEAAIDDFMIYEGAPLGVNNMPENVRAEVYPNPADNTLNISLPEGSKGSITLYDLTGKIINKTDVNESAAKYSINTSGLAAGTYLVLTQTQYAVQNTKVIINHR
ncbi:MAG: T9SS type A sorting domain-containing protein [Chitinophagaceae bacterium]|nr:T9SS type A sorting domain-containing protein [Chitinophagaceae bacterium]